MVLVVYLLINLKNLKVLLKINSYGTISMVLYVVFIFFGFYMNMEENGSIKAIEEKEGIQLQVLTTDFLEGTGTLSLSFLIHVALIPVYRQNIHFEKNTRDLTISYVLAFIIYSFVGVIGYLAVFGKTPAFTPQTVIDYFEPSELPVFIVSFLFAVFLLCVQPFIVSIARNQFLGIFYTELEYIPAYVNQLYNIIFCLICFSFSFINQDPGSILGLTGAIIGYFIIYIFPICLHLKCLYNKKNNLLQSDISESNICDHDYSVRKQTRYVSFGSILLIGLFLLISGIYKNLIQS